MGRNLFGAGSGAAPAAPAPVPAPAPLAEEIAGPAPAAPPAGFDGGSLEGFAKVGDRWMSHDDFIGEFLRVNRYADRSYAEIKWAEFLAQTKEANATPAGSR